MAIACVHGFAWKQYLKKNINQFTVDTIQIIMLNERWCWIVQIVCIQKDVEKSGLRVGWSTTANDDIQNKGDKVTTERD